MPLAAAIIVAFMIYAGVMAILANKWILAVIAVIVLAAIGGFIWLFVSML